MDTLQQYLELFENYDPEENLEQLTPEMLQTVFETINWDVKWEDLQRYQEAVRDLSVLGGWDHSELDELTALLEGIRVNYLIRYRQDFAHDYIGIGGDLI